MEAPPWPQAQVHAKVLYCQKHCLKHDTPHEIHDTESSLKESRSGAEKSCSPPECLRVPLRNMRSKAGELLGLSSAQVYNAKCKAGGAVRTHHLNSSKLHWGMR